MTADPAPSRPGSYDPWHELSVNWPEVEVVLEPMAGDLLGIVRYPVIVLRAGTSAAQRRCTLAHELVHLERGVHDCGPWAAREELLVHREVARRLISPVALAAAVRALGAADDVAALAHALDVDTQTLRLRVALLTPAERAGIRTRAASEWWRVA